MSRKKILGKKLVLIFIAIIFSIIYLMVLSQIPPKPMEVSPEVIPFTWKFLRGTFILGFALFLKNIFDSFFSKKKIRIGKVELKQKGLLTLLLGLTVTLLIESFFIRFVGFGYGLALYLLGIIGFWYFLIEKLLYLTRKHNGQ